MERTSEQYAIEHGRYLANAARRFMLVLNQEAVDDGGGRPFDQDRRTDAWTALSDAIYEFEKRADHAYPNQRG